MIAVSSFRSMPSASRNVVRSYKSTTVSMGMFDGKWLSLNLTLSEMYFSSALYPEIFIRDFHKQLHSGLFGKSKKASASHILVKGPDAAVFLWVAI